MIVIAHYIGLRVIYGRPTIYIFILFLRSFFFPHLISAVGDWMSAILRHMVWS